MTARALITPTVALLSLFAFSSGADAGPRVGAELVGHFPAGKQPTTVRLVDNGSQLLVANRGDSTIDVFQAATMEKQRSYPIETVGHGVWGIEAMPSGRELIAANWVGETLTVFDRE